MIRYLKGDDYTIEACEKCGRCLCWECISEYGKCEHENENTENKRSVL